MNDIKDLIVAIAEGDSVAIDNSFKTTMAHKIADRLDDMRVSLAQGMFSDQLAEGTKYATGDWHVTDELHGGIHSTHSSARKAKNMADKLNAADYDENKGDKSRSSGNLFHSRYGTQAASEPQSIWNKAKSKSNTCSSSSKSAEGSCLAKEELELEDFSIEELEEFMLSEEFEQLDELSKQTLGSYIVKASTDKAAAALDNAKSKEGADTKLLKRHSGIKKAVSKLTKESTELDEASYSAKAAHAGKDIGKPGKNFEKIEKKAEEEYGSKEAGKRVAGAILAKLRNK